MWLVGNISDYTESNLGEWRATHALQQNLFLPQNSKHRQLSGKGLGVGVGASAMFMNVFQCIYSKAIF